MALDVRIVFDHPQAQFAIFAGERVGVDLLVIEAGLDGELLGRVIRPSEDPARKPLLRIAHSYADELFRGLAKELAKLGFCDVESGDAASADSSDVVIEVLKDALVDARDIRDRLLTVIEEKH